MEGGNIKGGVSSKRKRIDVLLVDLDLAPTRSRARSLIMEGVVFVDGMRLDKAGAVVKENSDISIRESSQKYVSRGGFKLESALSGFGVDVDGMTALDIGASTGGFTDCLLQKGASKIYAVDVGYGQLDWKLRNDERVVVMERVNARYIKPEDIAELVDVLVIDVSFISVTKILPPAVQILKPGGVLVALVKPQFEVGKGEVGKGGIVKDERKHKRVVEEITEFTLGLGFRLKGVITSPLLGSRGNKEFLLIMVSD